MWLFCQNISHTPSSALSGVNFDLFLAKMCCVVGSYAGHVVKNTLSSIGSSLLKNGVSSTQGSSDGGCCDACGLQVAMVASMKVRM